MKIIITISSILVFLTISGFSQNYPERNFDDPTLFLTKEAYGGGFIHSNGWGLNFRYGKHVTGTKKRIFEGEFATMKHPKEVKVVNPFIDNAKSYIYGKQNMFLILRANYGIRKILSYKGDRGGVEINYNYFIGASLGFTKPIYLEILYPTDNPTQYKKVTEKFDHTRHFNDNIYGNSGFAYGINELTLHPGISSKLGVSFDWSRYDDEVRKIETGIMFDIYPKKIPIMAVLGPNDYNKQMFFNLYFNYLFGKKW